MTLEQKYPSDELMYAYKMGFDAGMYGPTEKNRDYRLFLTDSSYRAWQEGRDEAIKARFSGRLP